MTMPNSAPMKELSVVAQADLYSLISGTGEYTTSLGPLCKKIVNVIESFLDPDMGIDLTDPLTLDFLKVTLPALTEAFIRRTTLREHKDDVASMLLVVAKLLGKPASHDIVELCELRNFLLSGVITTQLKFINTKQFTRDQNLHPHLSSGGFFGDYGTPSVVFMGNKMLNFWPDEWQRAIGGIKAVGHFVEWYQAIDPREMVVSEQKSQRDGARPRGLSLFAADTAPLMTPIWLVGRIVGMQRNLNMYVIQLEPECYSTICAAQRKQAEQSGSPESFASSFPPSEETSPSPPPNLPTLFWRVDLTQVHHHWVDDQFRNRIPTQPTPSGQAIPGSDSLLQFSHSDVGHFIRIWWARYNIFYYGRVIRYDPVSYQHTIAYEDGEVRPYDMVTKDYELLLTLPKDLLGPSKNALSDRDASKIVADWHRALPKSVADATAAAASATQASSGGSNADSGGRSGGGGDDNTQKILNFHFITRPAAPTALTVSIYQLAVLDTYFHQGGIDSIFQSLTDASQPAPVSRILLLHLQLVFHMRAYVDTERFQELVWDLKESIPGALFRYEDAQIKELSAKTLHEILNTLKDLIQLIVNKSQYMVNQNVKETMEEIRLKIGSFLLVCSQLQKRYLGLSMIRETLENVQPKLDAYVARRYAAIDVPRVAKSPVQRTGGSTSNGRINVVFMDKWLLENEVVERIFGESLHQDLASKSDAILLYMASRKILTEKHLSLIWNASLGVHEAVVRIIHQLLILIVPSLGLQLRNYLFSLMSALPAKEYTEQILVLLKVYTVQALIAAKEEEKYANSSSTSGGGHAAVDAGGKKGQVVVASQREWVGFKVLWKFIQDPAETSKEPNGYSGVNEGLIDLAVQLLVDLLQEEFKDERELVMQRCLDNIESGHSVPVSLLLLRRTLALYPQAPKSWFGLSRPSGPKVITVSQQIEKLIKNSKLLEILFRDLDSYQRSIAVSENSDGTQPHLQQQQQQQQQVGMKKSISGANIGKAIMKMGRVTNTSPPPSALHVQTGTINKPAPPSGRVQQLKGVSERLDFLRFIISGSSVRLNETQTMLLWNAFGEGASTPEALDKFFVWFNSLVNKESKALATLLVSLANESDPTEQEQRSKLAFLSPLAQGVSQQQGYAYLTGANAANILALLSGGADGETSGLTALGAAASSGVSAMAGAGAAGGAGPTAAMELHSTFEEGVLIKLFEEHMLKWAFQYDKIDNLSRIIVANLCFKLFFHCNISNRGIKVESDGSWNRVGPLVGIPLLWRIALDCTDSLVANAAIALIIELHHKTTTKSSIKSGDSYKAALLQVCFRRLYYSMQSLLLGEGSEDLPDAAVYSRDPERVTSSVSNSSNPAVNTSTNNYNTVELALKDEWFHDNDVLLKPAVIASRIERLVITLRGAIHRFYTTPAPLCTIKIVVGREAAAAFTLVLKATDKIGQLRRKIAEHFKESADVIQITRTGKTSNSLMGMTSTPNQEYLEKDDQTLVEAKINAQDTLTAQKKETPAAVGMGMGMGAQGNQAANKQSAGQGRARNLKDLLTPQDLTTNLLNPLNPLGWIGANASSSAAATTTTGGREGDRVSAELQCYDLFAMPPFPLISVIESKLAIYDVMAAVEERDNAAPSTSTINPHASAIEHKQKVLEMLIPIMKPHFIDQLLEMLDGYLSTEHSVATTTSSTTTGSTTKPSNGMDLSALVWDIVMSLPIHAPLAQELRSVISDPSASTSMLHKLLSASCPYRLLYHLQILESFLTGLGADRSMSVVASTQTKTPTNISATAGSINEWTVKFFHIGGAEFIFNLLTTFLDKAAHKEITPMAPYGSNSSGNSSANSGVYEGMPRRDVNSMLIALLSRISYHLLLADPLFHNWQSTAAGEMPDPTVTPVEGIPAGVILSSIDAAGLTERVLGCCLHTAEQYRAGMVTEVALKALCENSLMLIFGILNSVDNGAELVSNSDSLRKWITALCVKCSSLSVRRASCRRLFEAAANIFHKCADPSVLQEEKRSRMLLYDVIYQEIVIAVDAAGEGEAPSRRILTEKIRRGEQIYTLLSAIEALRHSPYLIFPQISSQKELRSSLKSNESQHSPRTMTPRSPRQLSLDDPSHQPALVWLFITKLVHHISTESFHSSRPDGNLVGILRVLLVFANSSDEKRVLLGSLDVETEDDVVIKLIPFLYCNCLFPSLQSAVPSTGEHSPMARDPVASMGNVEALCQTQESRRLAYALLYRLCESNPDNLLQLVEAINYDCPAIAVAAASTSVACLSDQVLGEVEKEEEEEEFTRSLPVWNYDPSALVKDPNAYVGLCNQGGTCYMNSFIQQLFHIPAFKSGLLRVNAAGNQAEKEKSADGEPVDENARLLFQLQVMFGFMKFSQKSYYDTLPFCRAFLDYDGEPVSLSEQKDSYEFAGMLFDKLENNKEAAALLQNTIQGKIVYRTRSIETRYRSEREENFYMITAEVKDKATLEDSLELFTAEELFSGDNKIEDCDAGRKVEALRGCSIRTLPGTLIIHLKRFEFDLETMNRKKVNDLITFPTDLNMFNYTEEGLQAKEDKLRAAEIQTSGSTESPNSEESGAEETSAGGVGTAESHQSTATSTAARQCVRKERKPDGYYQYSLKGIVAHVGAIDRGHYYSFIKDKERGGGWLEFNDRSVLPFSEDAIPAECFGGKEEYTGSNGSTVTRIRENNAYLLVYERAEYGVDAAASSDLQRIRSDTIDEAAGSGGRNSLRSGSIDETTPHRGVSKFVMRAVSRENAEFQRDRFLFSSIHFAFAWQLQHLQSVNALLDAAKAALDTTNKKYIYSSGSNSPVLRLVTPGESNSDRNTLVSLVLANMRFIVEVLVRARAQACVHMFIERVEEIVMQDSTGACALALLNVFGAENELRANKSAHSQETANATIGGAATSARPLQRQLNELEIVERSCHPWLAQMILYCPHVQTMKSFLRLLLNSMKAAKAAHTLMKSDDSNINEDHDKKEFNSKNNSKNNSNGTSFEYPPSAMIRLVDKILRIVGKPQLDFLGSREGFELKCLFLYQLAGMGEVEKALLVKLEAIPKLSCSVIAVSSTASRNTEIKLQFCTDLVAQLVVAAKTVSKGISPTAQSVHHHNLRNAMAIALRPIDVQAFLSRDYLQQAIELNCATSGEAIQHIYELLPEEERVNLLAFLVENLLEHLSAPSSAKLNYRPYFKILSEVLLGVALPMIIHHQSVVAKIITKAQLMSTRFNTTHDSDYVYDATRFMLHLGTASAAAHDLVMQCRDQWKPISLRLAAAKRCAVLPPDAASTATNTVTPANAQGGGSHPVVSGSGSGIGGASGNNSSSQPSSGGKKLLGKVAAASAFMMN